jgi:3'(2'), 5'-bisphosphate nucleotidase
MHCKFVGVEGSMSSLLNVLSTRLLLTWMMFLAIKSLPYSAFLRQQRLTRLFAIEPLSSLSNINYDKSSTKSEMIIISSQISSKSLDSVKHLKNQRPSVELIEFDHILLNPTTPLWVSFDKHSCMQYDGVYLEDMYLSGKTEINSFDTAKIWNKLIDERTSVFSPTNSIRPSTIKMGDGGALQRELDIAISIVHRASYLSRYLQHILLKDNNTINKDDKSPVTIADYAVQALIIDELSKNFPNDKFIAEENSKYLEHNALVREGVINSLSIASGRTWKESELFTTIDKGEYDAVDTSDQRIWVLDPVDGTKGFMRGEHYCIALALLQSGKPQLSVLGCPNLSLSRVIQGREINKIEETIMINGVNVFLPSSGCVFFAVDKRGAFARSSGMNLNGALEVSVSSKTTTEDLILCESVEATHGDRKVTTKVYDNMKLKHDYVRLDGQCKYCVVGSGAADGNMRLPPAGYIEKIWDHAPGSHFVTEAGGKVTDLNGNVLDFSKGRFLNEQVHSIVATNGLLHEPLVNAIHLAKRSVEK